MLLTIAICIQINTIKAATKNVGTNLRDKGSLKSELLNLQSKYNILYKELEKEEKELEKTRSIASKKSEKDQQNEIEIKNNNKLLGLTDISGPGLIIRLDENREINTSEVLNVSGFLVHEEDLLYIINELFNAGADAVSINNQRIISTTSIRCDGNIIRINEQMVGVPIEIKAIGYPERLDGALTRPGGYLEIMANDGVIVTVEKSENVNVPKFNGVFSYKYLTRGDV